MPKFVGTDAARVPDRPFRGGYGPRDLLPIRNKMGPCATIRVAPTPVATVDCRWFFTQLQT